MFTYITTTTVPSFFELMDIFSASYAEITWTLALPALGLAAGPLVWSSLADIYGRRIIFIIGSVIALVSTVGAAKAMNYSGYMAARFFQGLGVSPAATVGLATINDIYFDHERGQKIGLWVLALDAGLLVGPIFGGFLDLVSPEWIQWFTAIIFAASLVLECAFMTETLYPRNYMLSQLPAAGSQTELGAADLEKVGNKRSDASAVTLTRTKQLFFFNVKPVPGMRHPKPWDTIIRFVKTFKLLAVFASVWAYCFLWYWWMLCVITLLPVAYIQYSPQIQGLLFIGLLLGTVFAEILCSGRLSDIISTRMAKKRGEHVRLPEDRLWLTYPAAFITALGVIVWGISIDKGYHWMVGQVALFLFAAGIQVGNTVVCAYVVDAYPLQSMSVITFYAVWINMSAFISPVSQDSSLLSPTVTSLTLSSSSSSVPGKRTQASLLLLPVKASSSSSAASQPCGRCRNGDQHCEPRVDSRAGSTLSTMCIEAVSAFEKPVLVGAGGGSESDMRGICPLLWAAVIFVDSLTFNHTRPTAF